MMHGPFFKSWNYNPALSPKVSPSSSDWHVGLPSLCPSLFVYSLHHALSAGVLLLGLRLHFTKPAVAHSTPIVEYHPPFLPNTQ
jgi:hypothetical protein